MILCSSFVFIKEYASSIGFIGYNHSHRKPKPIPQRLQNSPTVDSPNKGSIKNITPALKREYCILLSCA
jgi:hypothetical protein